MTAKKTSYSSIVRQHEDNERPQIEQSRVRLANAYEARPQLKEAAELATEAREEFDIQWRRGNSGQAAEGYPLALAEEVRATALADAAKKEIENAKKGVKSTDTRVAELAAQVAQKAFPTVTVLSSFSAPSEKPRPEECPVVLVIPTETVENSNGTLSGAAELHFFRDSVIHQRLDAAKIEQAARDLPSAGVSVLGARLGSDSVRTATAGPGLMRDRLTLKVDHGATGAVPVVTRTDPPSFSRVLAEYLANAVKSPSLIRAHPEALNRQTNFWTSDRIAVLPHEVAIVSDVVDDQGNRTLTADASVIIRNLHYSGGLSTGNWGDAADAFVKRLSEGWTVPGCGLSTSSERITEGSEVLLTEEAARTLAAGMKPSNEPRVNSELRNGPWSSEGRWQLVVRATFTSRVAA